MFEAIFAFITSAAATYASLGQIGQFLVSTLVQFALSGTKIPGLTDLKVQTSAYGKTIPLLYGTRIRVAGNVIDKSDLIPIKHHKGGVESGLVGQVGGVKYFTYDVHLQVLLADGVMLAPNGLVRILADGKCIFDRDATGATPGTTLANGALEFQKSNKTQQTIQAVRLYRGEATQGVDDLVQNTLHDPGDAVPAYRNCTTIVIERMALEDFGSRVPNLEFVVEPLLTSLGDIVNDLTERAGTSVIDTYLINDTTVRGYAVARDGSLWDAIQPLGSTFAFDLVQVGPEFKIAKRGAEMRTIIPETEYAAGPPKETRATTKDVKLATVSRLVEQLTLNYFDTTRDLTPGTQRAGRNDAVSENKVSVDIPIVLTPDEARSLAQRSLYEAAAAQKLMTLQLSDRYRWLNAGDLVGLYVAGYVEPFRIQTMTRSPNGVIDLEVTYEDALLYTGTFTGDPGNYPTNALELSGDTIMQLIDAPITRDRDDTTGFIAMFLGTGPAWRGAEVYRALGIGSPLTFEVIGNIGAPAIMADCDTTLATGPADVWDYVNTLTVTLLDADDTLTSYTETEVLQRRRNLAWVGDTDGQGGEYIHFATATPSSPAGTYILSSLLRGRYGTEDNRGTHGSGERFVMFDDSDSIYRVNATSSDWNTANTYRADSLPGGEDGTEQAFTNTGQAKRPIAPVLLRGTRNGTNNDIVISWTRRSRYNNAALGGGATPLGEGIEAYEVDVFHAGTVVRTLTSATPSVTYTTAMQTADGNTPGALAQINVYQMSDVYGRGEVAAGVV